MSVPNYQYIPNIPNPPHLPIQDVPNMYINTNSSQNIWTSDHIGFNTAGSGWHQQMTIAELNTFSSVPTGAQAIVYAREGFSDPSNAFLQMQTTKCSLPISAIRAFGTFNTNAGTPMGIYFTNVSGLVYSAPNYIITLSSGVCAGANATVIVSCSLASASAVQGIYSPGPPATITFGYSSASLICNFMVLQY